MPFVDTNVVIYAVSVAEEDEVKAARALELLNRRDLSISVQVLQEFYVQATRPTRSGALTHREAVDFAASLLRFHVQELTVEVVQRAFEIRGRCGISYWDAAILAAARTCGCDVVYSEDLNAGQDYDGVQVVNPFA